MYLDVHKASGQVIFRSEKETSPTWTYVLNAGEYVYTFSGPQAERKLFATFEKVSSYRKALSAILAYVTKQIGIIGAQMSAQALVVNHNFVETCKHMRDPITDILPKVRGTHSEKVRAVADALEKTNPLDIATAFLDVDRAITNLQVQISGLQIIAGDYKPDMSLNHSLVALLDSFLIPFDESFEDRKIRVVNCRDSSVNGHHLVNLDHTVVSWVFYHLLNNAEKYAYPGTDLILRSDSNTKEISLEMVSLRVDSQEVENIFKLGVRGNHASNFSGDGLGMFFAKTGLETMGGTIEFVSGSEVKFSDESGNYCENKVLIKLP